MTTLHAIFADEPTGRAAAGRLQAEGLADDANRRPELFETRLYHTPHAGQSAIPLWFLGGFLGCGVGASAIAFVLASTGGLGVPVPPAAAAMFWFLAGSALGGLSAALGGAGAFRKDYYDASRDLHDGQVLLTVHVPWERADDAEALLDDAGATSVRISA